MSDGQTVTLKASSYRKAQERQHIAEALRANAEERYEHCLRWGQEQSRDARKAWARCSYLYGLAAALGATPEQLAASTCDE